VRTARVERKTNETDITLSLNLDGTGKANVNTGVGFFDHMLTQIARHGLFDLEINAKGDLHIDAHHTVEDVGICLGKAFLEALAQPVGIARYGSAIAPMDESLAEAAVDISGRPFLVFRADIPGERVGQFDTELTEEFFRAFAVNARITLHLSLRYGSNAHHAIEGLFKAAARALRIAVSNDPRVQGVPSTKGMLET
jgi:imidazoleglycerol-phosphate dehydratase